MVLDIILLNSYIVISKITAEIYEHINTNTAKSDGARHILLANLVFVYNLSDIV